jgi:hypothetical protein
MEFLMTQADLLIVTFDRMRRAQNALNNTGDEDNYKLDEAMALLKDATNIVEGELLKHLKQEVAQ